MSTRMSYDSYGPPRVLHAEEETLPPPGPGQVTIWQELIGVNPVDWKMVAGFFRQTDREPFPHVPGWASTGVIEAIGEGVSGYRPGDAVIAAPRGGAYRQRMVIDATLVVARPAGMSREQAAGIPSSAVAGYSMVDNLNITASDTVLVHGAAGAVGSAAAQIARSRGASVIGTASPSQHDYLRILGITPVPYGPGVEGRVLEISSGGITASVDAVGGQCSVTATQSVLAPGGRAVTAWGDEYSASAGIPWLQHAEDELPASVRLAELGHLKVRIGKTFPLTEAAVALELSRTGHARGKLLLAP